MEPISPDPPPDPPPPAPVPMDDAAIMDSDWSSQSNPKNQDVIFVPSKKRQHSDSDLVSSAKKTIIDKESATASVQTVYTHPEMSILGIRSYEDSDSGPFIVHVSRIDPDPVLGTSIRPMKFGQFLFNNKIENIHQDGVKKVGRNRISINFKSASGANRFLNNPVVQVHKYEATIPTFNVTRMGIVRGVPVDWSMQEFVDSLQTPGSTARIMKARRLNRKIKKDNVVSWEPTQTVVLTFRGQQLPTRVFSYYSSLAVETYHYPTIQCMKCCRFGHIKAQCRSSPRCYRCAQPHCGDDCNVLEQDSTCLNCSSHHFSTSRSCPEQERQKSIKMMMSSDGISYEEASLRFPKISRAFSNVTKEAPSRPPLSTPYASTSLSQASEQPRAVQSYKKTIFRNPQTRAPMDKSYDKVAHQAIVSREPSSLPNGYCLQMAQASPSPSQVQPQDQLLVQLLTIILNILSQNSINIPSHVAEMIAQISSLSPHNNYGSGPNHSSVELQESSSENS